MRFWSKRMSPPSGWRNPASMRSTVVFPQPEGPSRKNISPGWMEKETSSTTRDSGLNDFVRWLAVMVMGAISGMRSIRSDLGQHAFVAVERLALPPVDQGGPFHGIFPVRIGELKQLGLGA